MEIVMGAFEMGDTVKERDHEQFDLLCSLPDINTFFLCNSFLRRVMIHVYIY